MAGFARKPGRPEGVSGEETRRLIVTVGAELVARKGVADTSLSEIAKAAGLTAPAIYRYFPSKTDILVEAATDMYEQILVRFQAAVNQGGSWRDRLTNISAACIELYREDGVMQRLGLAMQLESVREPLRFEPVNKAISQLDALFEAIIEDAIADGTLPKRTDPKVAGPLLRAMQTNAVAANVLIDSGTNRFEQFIDAFTALIIRN